MADTSDLVSKMNRLIADFGLAVQNKFSPEMIRGEQEEQLRNPLEQLITQIGKLLRPVDGDGIQLIGETRRQDLKLRLDFAVCHGQDLIGFVEVKAPAKGADPRRFKANSHDGEQWEKLKSIPNLLYCSGDEFSLWHYGEIDGEVVRLEGSVTDKGQKLRGSTRLLELFQKFFGWQPIPPESVTQLAEVTARLCRLLRDEFAEQLSSAHGSVITLQSEWREMLFPDADDQLFADSFAQAVTFGMLLARVDGIDLKNDISAIGNRLENNHSLIGAALQYISQDRSIKEFLAVSQRTLIQILNSVDWSEITKNSTADSWLFFYEQFLQVYDPALRKATGSYYTPIEIVDVMIGLVDETLRHPNRFKLRLGIADNSVKIIDPAMGTGTYLLQIIRYIAKTIEADEGPGSVNARVKSALKRLIGFEIQFGPFVVAQARLLSEFSAILKISLRENDLMVYLDDTLENPEGKSQQFFGLRQTIAASRKQANQIKISEDIMVVIGNPPYKEKAWGKGGWVENGDELNNVMAPLNSWKNAPKDWKMGVHAHKLSNLYIYFWRWASWKVFGGDPVLPNTPTSPRKGIICFITMTGFINGPGFQKMRADLRRDADEIWVINCSPEGMQPPVANAVFTQIINPVCIMLAVRLPKHNDTVPAKVYYRSLPRTSREEKFDILAQVKLGDSGWELCDDDWRASFLPKIKGDWAKFPSLESIFNFNGLGVTPHRVWVIAPDQDSLLARWRKLIQAKTSQAKSEFFLDTRDRKVAKKVKKHLYNFPHSMTCLADEKQDCLQAIPYSFRSFDRQFLIPDNRVLDCARPPLWNSYSDQQIFLTSLERFSPEHGPAVSFCSFIPDLHHYKGSFGGRVFPLWADAEASKTNIKHEFLDKLSKIYRRAVTAPEVMAYIAAVAAHPAYTARFKEDLQLPGLRIPITRSESSFNAAVELGKTVIWLHCYGERFADSAAGRPPSAPRLPRDKAPRHSGDRPIPDTAAGFPDRIDYLPAKQWLLVGDGVIENVSPEVWNYSVSGMQVVRQWFSYRKKDRTRPIMGDRRKPSELGKIQPDHWLADYTADLLNLLHVLGRLVELEPEQAMLLETICDGELLSATEITSSDIGAAKARKSTTPITGLLL